nr:DUF427 domain-containing protein [Calycomorphotria hydatis]
MHGSFAIRNPSHRLVVTSLQAYAQYISIASFLFKALFMPKAIWNDTVIAESDVTELVEGNHYFPPGSLNHDYLIVSETTTVCGWKGTASYYHLTVNDQQNADAAWYYADPKPDAAHIKDHVAFWKGVRVEV